MDQINKTNPHSWPYYAQDEIDAVVDVLRSGDVNQWNGTNILHFQELLAQRLEVPHVIAVANGSVALELALRAFDIGSGDEVIVTSRSFIASASCVSIVGATPVFADVDADSGNINSNTIAPHISSRTKAIIPVHIGGWPCDMPAIMELAEAHGLQVIEDCAQAIGAEIDGKPVGSFGHAGTFSFCQDKIISTGGEGGAVCFRNRDSWQKAWSYKDHGKDLQRAAEADADPTPWFKWVHGSLGTNLRMTEMQAAIGIKQLDKLDGWLKRRQKIANLWQDGLKGLKIVRIPVAANSIKQAYYRLYIYLEPDEVCDDNSLNTILLALQAADVPAQTGTCPEIYEENAFTDIERAPREIAHQLGQTSIAIPIHPRQELTSIERNISTTKEILEKFSR